MFNVNKLIPVKISNKAKRAPHTPGIYIFKNKKSPIYIGKAADLKNRLSSYFRVNSGEKVRQLLQEATRLEWIKASSEVEAFLKEAELIKKYRPKYNYLLRDDKNYFYVGITREKFPRIFITHQPYKIQKSKIKNQNERLKLKNDYLGPFTNGVALKSVLKLLRRVFPYCTCKTLHQRPCLNAEIGRCPGYCCTMYATSKKKLENDYRETIRNIIAVLSGKKKRILTDLKRSMNNAVKKEDFEKAGKIRDQIEGLENIFSHRPFLEARPLIGSRTSYHFIAEYIRNLLGTKSPFSRVEGYDISNISGQEATGSMVVFIDGLPEKSEYRKFKIKTVSGANDVAMLQEIIRRRLAHPEWPYPDLMLIDGGKPQLNAVLKILWESDFPQKVRLPKVAALAKREEELYIQERKTPIKLSTLPQNVALFFQRVRDESHRFAKKYHHKLREISYRQ